MATLAIYGNLLQPIFKPMYDVDLFQESEELGSDPVLPPLAVHNLSYIGSGATIGNREAEAEEGSPLVQDPDTPTESIGGRYLIPDGAPPDAWESDSLDR